MQIIDSTAIIRCITEPGSEPFLTDDERRGHVSPLSGANKLVQRIDNIFRRPLPLILKPLVIIPCRLAHGP
jgi:hypothetical protein